MVTKNQEAVELTPKPGYSFLYLSLLFLWACDATTNPIDNLALFPEVAGIEIPIDSVVFTRSNGFVDTTITLPIEATIYNIDGSSIFGFVVRDISSLAVTIEGSLDASSEENMFTGEANIPTSTTTIENLLIEVYAFDESGRGGYAQTPFYIVGFSSEPPTIVRTTSPGTIIRPTSGSVPAVFTAEVADSDGNETIERVFLRIIDFEDGEVEGSPFDMADDGASLGDSTANDNTFTWSLEVPANPSSGRIERDFDIEFFALDQGGLYSDTVRTTFSIRGN
ncbi:MAG: hypothetical protein ED557_01655 [Balneola sp.]|nr:MAG: hypothetical protein ED557_01655 [Balneola sp.]